MEEIENTEETQPVQPTQETVEESPPADAEASAPEVPSEKEVNLANLRKAKEAAERERDAYFKRLQEYEQSQQQVQSDQRQKQPEIGDDDLAEGRHLKAVREEMNAALTEMRIKSSFPDYERVVNADTINRLRTAYPELAMSLATAQDKYNQAASVYTLIKKLGIYDGENHQQNEYKVQQNNAKPRPLSSVSPQQGDSPLSQANAFANGLTEELKSKLYREMMDAKKGS